VTLPLVWEKGNCVRTLFTFIFITLIGSTNLSGQVITRPVTPKQAAPQTNIYLVTFRSNTTASDKVAVMRISGARVRRAFNALNAASVELPDAAALARLQNDPRVLSVFANRSITLLAAQGRGGTGGGNGTKPKAPANLAATAISSSQINIGWNDNSDNETGFAIERCAGSGCSNFSEISRVEPNITSFADLGLTAQTTYRYRVLAFNEGGSSKYTNTAEATTQSTPPPPQPPSAPSNLSSSIISSTQIDLSWSDNSNNEDGFQLQRCAGTLASCPDANFQQIGQLGPNVTSFNNTGLQAQTTYTYRVHAYNSAGSSTNSNSVEATTPAAPPPLPSAPSNMTSSVVSYSQINLSWTDNATNEDGFRLERCNGPLASCGDVNFVQVAQVGPNVTSFNNAGLQALNTYTYRVRSFNSTGTSGYSNYVEATTPIAPPAAPSNLTSSVISYSVINLAWLDNSSTEDGFQLERCIGAMANCVNFVQIAQIGPNVLGFSDVSLLAQTTYTYRVRTYNSSGPSAYSNSVEASTPAAPPQPPAAPNSLASSVISSSQINLSWTDNSNNEDGFHLERCTGAIASCVNFVQIAQVGSNVTTFNNVGLQPQTTYTYRARAFSSAGASNYSNAVEATTPAAPPPPPTAPSNLTSSVISTSQINLSWSDNSSNEDGFRLERCTAAVANCPDANFVQITQVGASVTSFNNVGLQAQTTYTYRVRAFNSAGSSAYSNSVQATTPAAPPSTQVVPGGVQRIGAAPGRLNWTGAGVGVAVVDTGLDFNHQDLGLDPEIPGVNSFSAFGGSCQDFHGHGTHVAGIIGARNNNIDVVGVAPNATIYCVRVFEPDPVQEAVSTDEDVMAGLDWIAANANALTPRIRVVNMSLGREKTPDDDNPNHPLHLAVKALYDMGISVVVAAGNDPQSEVSLQVPADYPEVMAVASTSAQTGVNGVDGLFPPCVGVPNIKADTASYFTTDGAFLGGVGVTVSAPGEQEEDIYDFAGSCFLESIGILSLALDGGTTELSGTSMASPHVAGVVTLMWEKELSLGLTLAPESARTRIRNNVDRLGTAPLDSPLDEYTFDGQREGVIWAPAAVGNELPPPQDVPPLVSIVSPATGASFSAGANIAFQGTATDPEDGNIASSLVWTSSKDGQIGTGASFTRTLTNGNHTITASLTDSGGNPASASTSITVGASSTPTQVKVDSITYSQPGTTLFYTVKLVNEFGAPVPGATVSVDIMEWVFTGWIWISTTTTNNQGNAQFQLLNADFGCYVTSVRSVTAPGLTFVGGTPSNNFCNF
jgi:subtilisin family serine protease